MVDAVHFQGWLVARGNHPPQWPSRFACAERVYPKNSNGESDAGGIYTTFLQKPLPDERGSGFGHIGRAQAARPHHARSASRASGLHKRPARDA
jgi:hypothetical protein